MSTELKATHSTTQFRIMAYQIDIDDAIEEADADDRVQCPNCGSGFRGSYCPDTRPF